MIAKVIGIGWKTDDTHDRAFIDDLATQVWSMEQGKLTTWDGNYSDYVAERARREQAGLVPTNGASSPSHNGNPPAKVDPREQSKAAQRQDRAAERERARQEKRRQQAESRISELEARLNTVSDALTAATDARDLEAIVKLGTEYAHLEEELDQAYTDWQQVEEEVET